MIPFRSRVIPIVILPRPLGSGGVNFTAIKSPAPFSITDQIVGPGYFLEFLFGFWIAGIEVRMQLFRKLAVRFLDIICRRCWSNIKNFIWIFHCPLRAISFRTVRQLSAPQRKSIFHVAGNAG